MSRDFLSLMIAPNSRNRKGGRGEGEVWKNLRENIVHILPPTRRGDRKFPPP